jgi:hypothetical protein
MAVIISDRDKQELEGKPSLLLGCGQDPRLALSLSLAISAATITPPIIVPEFVL